MTEDTLPPDVYAVLDQLLAEAREAIATEEYDTARSAVESAATVTENKVPSGSQQEVLEHCCRTVGDLLDDATIEGEAAAAAREYLTATRDRLTVEGE